MLSAQYPITTLSLPPVMLVTHEEKLAHRCHVCAHHVCVIRKLRETSWSSAMMFICAMASHRLGTRLVVAPPIFGAHESRLCFWGCASALCVATSAFAIDAFSFLSGFGLRWEPTAPRSRNSVCYAFSWNGISLSSPYYYPSRITTLHAISSTRLHATTSCHCRLPHPPVPTSFYIFVPRPQFFCLRVGVGLARAMEKEKEWRFEQASRLEIRRLKEKETEKPGSKSRKKSTKSGSRRSGLQRSSGIHGGGAKQLGATTGGRREKQREVGGTLSLPPGVPPLHLQKEAPAAAPLHGSQKNQRKRTKKRCGTCH